MKKAIRVTGMSLGLMGAAHATDVVNHDNKAYKLRVQSEGKLSISNYVIKARGTMYGLCGASFCSFEIPGSRIMAKKDERVTIHNGRLAK